MKTSIVVLSAFVFSLYAQEKIINKEIPTKSNDPQEITWEEVYHGWAGDCFAINSLSSITIQ